MQDCLDSLAPIFIDNPSVGCIKWGVCLPALANCNGIPKATTPPHSLLFYTLFTYSQSLTHTHFYIQYSKTALLAVYKKVLQYYDVCFCFFFFFLIFSFFHQVPLNYFASVVFNIFLIILFPFNHIHFQLHYISENFF